MNVIELQQNTLNRSRMSWTWSEKSVGQHNIKVIAYDEDGNAVEDEIKVWKFF